MYQIFASWNLSDSWSGSVVIILTYIILISVQYQPAFRLWIYICLYYLCLLVFGAYLLHQSLNEKANHVGPQAHVFPTWKTKREEREKKEKKPQMMIRLQHHGITLHGGLVL